MNRTRVVNGFFVFVIMLLITGVGWGFNALTAQGAEEANPDTQAAVISAAQPASAWPMFMYDPQHSGRSDFRGPASAVKVKWEGRPNSWVDVVALAMRSNGDLYVINRSNGMVVFDPRYGSETDQYAAVIKGTPLILKNGYIVSIDGSNNVFAMKNSDLYAWKYTFKEEGDISTTPASQNGAVFAFAPDGRLYSFNAINGEMKWKSDIYADTTPAIAKTGTIYTVAAGSWKERGFLFAVDPNNGNLIWKLQLSDEEMGQCNLAAADDGTIYVVSSKGNNIYAVTPQGQLEWKQKFNSALTAPALGKDGTIYIGGEDGTLFALNSDGSQKWQYQTKDKITAAPIIDSEGLVFISSGKLIYALNPSGQLLWRHSAKQVITSSPIIDSRGILYIAAGSQVTALYSSAPFAPRNMAASTDRFNNVTLTWTEADGNDEAGFIIEQKVGDNEYKQVGEAFRDTNSYAVSGVPSGSYTYRIKAYNSGGDSLYSNEVEVNITAAPGTGQVGTARFYLNKTNYYQESSSLLMDVAPTIIESRTFLPVRYVAEALGADVKWDAADSKVTVTRKGKTIQLWINNPSATVNGQAAFIDPQNHQVRPTVLPPGRTMLPIRFIAESLDCQVEWNADLQEVKIVYIR